MKLASSQSLFSSVTETKPSEKFAAFRNSNNITVNINNIMNVNNISFAKEQPFENYIKQSNNIAKNTNTNFSLSPQLRTNQPIFTKNNSNASNLTNSILIKSHSIANNLSLHNSKSTMISQLTSQPLLIEKRVKKEDAVPAINSFNLDSQTFSPFLPMIKQKEIFKKEEIKPQQQEIQEQQQQQQKYENRDIIQPLQHLSDLMGFVLIVFVFLFFSATIFWIFFANCIQNSEHKVLQFLKNDQYYCYLLPLIIPISAILLYINWAALKFFRHS